MQGEECTHEGIEAYAAIQFEQTKPSLRTFLKLWLMGGLSAAKGVGELKAVQDDPARRPRSSSSRRQTE